MRPATRAPRPASGLRILGIALGCSLALLAACTGPSALPTPTPTVVPTATPTPVPPPPPVPATTPGSTEPSRLAPPDELPFVRGELAGPGLNLTDPTTLAFGPDGRLYVGQLDGQITAITLEERTVTGVEVIAKADDLDMVLGIAFNPADPPEPVTLYVSHTTLFSGEHGPRFPGKISRLVAPDFRPVDLITGLPAGANEHGTNGIAFDAEGRLFIAQGGTTNAGAMSERHPRPETPLSGAILLAELQHIDFDGAVRYLESEVSERMFVQATGDVRVYAGGLRNPYDLVLHSNGHLYATDNGPNPRAGSASLDCAGEGEGPWAPDELNLIVRGQYYGHPNRNRGTLDPRQCVYHASDDVTGRVTPPIATLGYSVSANGLAEYTSDAFGGALRGDLIYVEWNHDLVQRVQLSPDGTRVESISQLVPDVLASPLDVVVGPDGTVYIAEWDTARIVYFAPPDG